MPTTNSSDTARSGPTASRTFAQGAGEPLLGASGLSADPRELLASPEPAAREALDLFAFRIAPRGGGDRNTLGGIDGLVFTSGIGEHQPDIRAAVCERLAWLGIAILPDANARNATRIDADGSRIAVLVVPTDEEQVIADETQAVLQARAAVP